MCPWETVGWVALDDSPIASLAKLGMLHHTWRLWANTLRAKQARVLVFIVRHARRAIATVSATLLSIPCLSLRGTLLSRTGPKPCPVEDKILPSIDNLAARLGTSDALGIDRSGTVSWQSQGTEIAHACPLQSILTSSVADQLDCADDETTLYQTDRKTSRERLNNRAARAEDLPHCDRHCTRRPGYRNRNRMRRIVPKPS